jgi:hypothetical protein
MPWDLHIIRASEFVKVDAAEHLELEASKLMLETIAGACIKRGVSRALLDLRPVPELPAPRFTVNELDVLIRTFAAAGFNCGQRLAVVYARDVHGGARKFAFIGRMRGLKVQAFPDFEEGINWLWRGPAEEDGTLRDALAIPIKDSSRARRVRVEAPSETIPRRAAPRSHKEQSHPPSAGSR